MRIREFFNDAKLRSSCGLVQFVVNEKLTRACYFQIALETTLYLYLKNRFVAELKIHLDFSLSPLMKGQKEVGNFHRLSSAAQYNLSLVLFHSPDSSHRANSLGVF